MLDGKQPRVPARTLLHALVVCVAGLVVSALMAAQQARDNAALTRQRFDTAADHLADQLTERMQRYVYGVRSARGAILAMGPNTRRDAFRDYVQSRDFAHEYPGARGFGFIRRVASTSVDAFLETARADDAPEFSIHSLTPHADDHYVIQYVEPSEKNQGALGLDIASNPESRDAAREALS